jgi:hypothetical protein
MSGAYREYEPPPEVRTLVACLWENDADLGTSSFIWAWLVPFLDDAVLTAA